MKGALGRTRKRYSPSVDFIHRAHVYAASGDVSQNPSMCCVVVPFYFQSPLGRTAHIQHTSSAFLFCLLFNSSEHGYFGNSSVIIFEQKKIQILILYSFRYCSSISLYKVAGMFHLLSFVSFLQEMSSFQ